jgi:beta-lactamase superfamily II metal-dependent hydrolase
MRLICLLILLPLTLGFSPKTDVSDPQVISVAFIDVGQGDATLIRDGAGFDVLIDGGKKTSAEHLLTYLHQVGVDDLEAILATHADRDHIGGFIPLLESDDIPVESVLYNGYPGNTDMWVEFVSAVHREGLSLIPIQYPQNLSWGAITIQVLNPPEDLIDPEQNKASIVLLLDYAQISILLPADIDSTVENKVLSRIPSVQADILKIAHHGSKYSTSQTFLDEVLPQEAIISVGANSYGHPTFETLTRLNSNGIKSWRTDFAGTVLFTSDGIDYTILPRLTFLPLSFSFPLIP